jgi:NADH:ubiquinone oxidoreductase subunit D
VVADATCSRGRGGAGGGLRATLVDYDLRKPYSCLGTASP